jgi:uncharacterized protein DUF3224
MNMRAKGRFDVVMNPQPPYDDANGVQLGRISIDKTFTGDLEATSHVEMLSAMTSVKGSAGYVAIERVTGTLQGQRGSFVLQHSGTMTRGAPQLTISVVPDSGSEGLTGIAGALTIEITDGKHFYTFDYTLQGA